jgi:uncharacterized membrane-anchored protein YjiN (DUF445 family)
MKNTDYTTLLSPIVMNGNASTWGKKKVEAIGRLVVRNFVDSEHSPESVEEAKTAITMLYMGWHRREKAEDIARKIEQTLQQKAKMAQSSISQSIHKALTGELNEPY